jgi:hypothetical protein
MLAKRRRKIGATQATEMMPAVADSSAAYAQAKREALEAWAAEVARIVGAQCA